LVINYSCLNVTNSYFCYPNFHIYIFYNKITIIRSKKSISFILHFSVEDSDTNITYVYPRSTLYNAKEILFYLHSQTKNETIKSYLRKTISYRDVTGTNRDVIGTNHYATSLVQIVTSLVQTVTFLEQIVTSLVQTVTFLVQIVTSLVHFVTSLVQKCREWKVWRRLSRLMLPMHICY
jgi:hypothetical protein